jgi:hypothetical protein
VWRIVLIGLISLTAIAAVGAGNASSATDAAEVRAVVDRQTRLFKQGRWQALYRLYTPRYRARCPFARFVDDLRRVRRVLGTRFSFRDVRVRVRGTRATIAYRAVTRSGRTITRVSFADGDTYVRLGGRWYDEYDAVSEC